MQVIKTSLGDIDEDAMIDQLESVVGSPSKCFHLMNLMREAHIHCCNSYARKPKSREAIFRQMAKNSGYTTKQIQAYIEYDQILG